MQDEKQARNAFPAIEGALDTINGNKRRYVAYLEGETGMDWDFHQGPLARADEAVFSLSNEWGDEIRFSLKAAGGGFDAVASVNPSRVMRRLALSSSDLGDPSKMFSWLLGSLPHSKQASLARCASLVARKLYASLPRGLRIIDVFAKVADSTGVINGFARAVYVEFIKKGVKGLPPINGKPVEEVIKDPNHPNVFRQLPSKYGADLGRRAYGSLLHMGLAPDAAADALQDFLIAFLSKSPIEPGSPLHEAESFTLRGLRMFAMTRRRQLKRRDRHDTPLVRDDGDGEVTVDVPDEAFDSLSRLLSQDYISRMTTEIGRKFPPNWGDAEVVATYFNLLEQGYHDKEIIAEKMLPLKVRNSRGGWDAIKKKWLYPEIKAYLENHPPMAN